MQELRDDYFDKKITDSEVTKILMNNIDEIDIYIGEYRETNREIKGENT